MTKHRACIPKENGQSRGNVSVSRPLLAFLIKSSLLYSDRLPAYRLLYTLHRLNLRVTLLSWSNFHLSISWAFSLTSSPFRYFIHVTSSRPTSSPFSLDLSFPTPSKHSYIPLKKQINNKFIRRFKRLRYLW